MTVGYFDISDGRQIELQDGMVIGRVAKCDVTLDDPKVSRRHARVIVDQGVVEIEDLGSSNGTTLNGRPVKRRLVRPGDIIGIGMTELTFCEGVLATPEFEVAPEPEPEPEPEPAPPPPKAPPPKAPPPAGPSFVDEFDLGSRKPAEPLSETTEPAAGSDLLGGDDLLAGDLLDDDFVDDAPVAPPQVHTPPPKSTFTPDPIPSIDRPKPQPRSQPKPQPKPASRSAPRKPAAPKPAPAPKPAASSKPAPAPQPAAKKSDPADTSAKRNDHGVLQFQKRGGGGAFADDIGQTGGAQKILIVLAGIVVAIAAGFAVIQLMG